MLAMETQQQAELAGARSEKEQLQRVLSRQSGAIAELEKSLAATSTNASLLQRQQLQLLEAVQSLVRLVTQGRGEPGRAGKAQAGCRQRYCSSPSREGAEALCQPLCSAQA